MQRVLIQGGGIGGLALATALAQQGVHVDVLEGIGREGVLGVGLNQPQNALAALDEIGLKQACLDVGFPFENLDMWNTNGDLVASIPPAPGLYSPPSNNTIGRPAYFDALCSAANAAGAVLHFGRTLIEMEDQGDEVRVEIGAWKGRRQPPERDAVPTLLGYDLVVGFDGARSAVRQHLFGNKYAPEYTGSGVWRAVIDRPAYLTAIAVVLAPDNVKAVLTPISETQMYFGLVTPEPGNPRHAQENFVELLHERTKSFTGRLAELRDSVSEKATNVYMPLEHVVVREPWFRGRIAVAGDAAHTSPPHLSQGAAMALEDAVTLASALRDHDDLDQALRAWYERRHERATLVADMSLALLKAESGHPLTEEDQRLLQMGLPGIQARLVQEAY